MAPDDYLATNGTLLFAPGETRKTIPVRIVGDAVKEPTEALSLNLTNALNALFATDHALATILDND